MAAKPSVSMAWLESIELKPDRSLASEKATMRTLRGELTAALAAQNCGAIDLKRCVYVIG